MRQGEARRAIGKVMRGVESANLHGEFERLGGPLAPVVDGAVTL